MDEAGALDRLASLVEQATSVLVFTGAGISTGSGIPDFRGPGGLWTKIKPVYFQDFVSSEEARVRHWELKLEGFAAFSGATPNAAHRALVDLERRGKLDLLVTQNIDGLHALAGNAEERIVEIHGTNRHVACIDCGWRDAPARWMAEFRESRRCPVCPDCGGFLKSATISFGQAMPEEEMVRAFAGADRADLAISIGSTLEVTPAAHVPLAAKQGGAPYAIVNRGPTAHDSICDVRLEGDVCELLPELVARL